MSKHYKKLVHQKAMERQILINQTKDKLERRRNLLDFLKVFFVLISALLAAFFVLVWVASH